MFKVAVDLIRSDRGRPILESVENIFHAPHGQLLWSIFCCVNPFIRRGCCTRHDGVKY